MLLQAHIATLVERYTRYVITAKVKNKDTESFVSVLIKQSKKLQDQLYKSLTWDRGTELADHERFTLETDINVYFLILAAHGNQAQTKTLMVCLGNISQKGLTYQYTLKLS